MSLDDDLRILSRIPLLATMEPDARRLLAFAGDSKVLNAGEVLFRKGEKADGGYVIQSGTIELTDGDGPGGAVVQIVQPNTLIGEIALISETERTVTAYAPDAATVLKISRTLFHRVLKEHPISAARLRAFIEKRVQDYARDLSASPLVVNLPETSR